MDHDIGGLAIGRAKKTSPNSPWQNHKKKFQEESYLSQVHTQQLAAQPRMHNTLHLETCGRPPGHQDSQWDPQRICRELHSLIPNLSQLLGCPRHHLALLNPGHQAVKQRRHRVTNGCVAANLSRCSQVDPFGKSVFSSFGPKPMSRISAARWCSGLRIRRCWEGTKSQRGWGVGDWGSIRS